MEETFRMGRSAGIRVGIKWSVLVIFALIAYGLAGQYLPRVYPREGVAAYVVAGVAAAVVFVASLLAHEIAHALVARRAGVRGRRGDRGRGRRERAGAGRARV